MLCCSYVSSIFIKPPICTPLVFFFLLFSSTINVTYFAFFFLSIFPICLFLFVSYITLKMKVLVAQLCSVVCNPMDCTPPGSSVHGILQARILEWIAIPFFRGFSWPRNQTQVSCLAGRFFTIWATREALKGWEQVLNPVTSILIRRRENTQKQRRPCEDEGRDWSDAATS